MYIVVMLQYYIMIAYHNIISQLLRVYVFKGKLQRKIHRMFLLHENL